MPRKISNFKIFSWELKSKYTKFPFQCQKPIGELWILSTFFESLKVKCTVLWTHSASSVPLPTQQSPSRIAWSYNLRRPASIISLPLDLEQQFWDVAGMREEGGVNPDLHAERLRRRIQESLSGISKGTGRLLYDRRHTKFRINKNIFNTNFGTHWGDLFGTLFGR